MKKFIVFVLAVILSFCTLTACTSGIMDEGNNEVVTPIPNMISEIPKAFYSIANEQGTLVELWYNTYESFSYGTTNLPLSKRAIVYLPFGYSDGIKYNVMYMMHGGWSNEAGLLGTPESPTNFKNVIDNAIENGIFAPLIIVCPTYNNTNANGQDSDNYSLALQLTHNYHNELVNDLIPAVEGRYSSYAQSTNTMDLIASRDHRSFMGFSMGSVTTWRTFEYCLDYFRYFFPSSGSITSSGSYMENIVKKSGYTANDFFIYAMSGTNDFAYSGFTAQINAMLATDTFIKADNKKDGNLAYNVKEGYSHNGMAQIEYFYNALSWVWKGKNEVAQSDYTAETKITDVINDPVFGNWGRMIFPVNSGYYGGTTLGNLSLTWYQNINVNHTVEICNYFKNQTLEGNQVFYDIYTEGEKMADPHKADTGLFFFRGEKNAPFAVTCAGGGWAYVGAMHDSFPHALELSKRGYNAFAIIYRPGAQTAYEDLARAISFIFMNAKALGVDTNGYSVWGGSAGGRMTATIASYGVEAFGGNSLIPKPSTAVIQYTGHTDYNPMGEVPTFVTVGENDGIANYQTMKRRIDILNAMGVPTEYHAYRGLGHGFGLGVGTIAEGWLDLAVEFWMNHKS
ncbi:MAG: hypothetical protein K2N64_01740 [Anaeroplasmataceae bacterium]|nr:hypothetical protein [Anaeroplasmataceae bacterium]